MPAGGGQAPWLGRFAVVFPPSTLLSRRVHSLAVQVEGVNMRSGALHGLPADSAAPTRRGLRCQRRVSPLQGCVCCSGKPRRADSAEGTLPPHLLA